MNDETKTDVNANEPPIRYSAESDINNPVKLIGGMLRDFVRGRELAGRLFIRNLRGLYRQTLLGLFWAFLPPIVNTAFWMILTPVVYVPLEKLDVPEGGCTVTISFPKIPLMIGAYHFNISLYGPETIDFYHRSSLRGNFRIVGPPTDANGYGILGTVKLDHQWQIDG